MGGPHQRPPPALQAPAASTPSVTFAAPAQLIVQPGTSCEHVAGQLAAAGLAFPLLAKRLHTNTSEDSHSIGVVHGDLGLRQLLHGAVAELQAPLVLQQYVPHGEWLYKVRGSQGSWRGSWWEREGESATCRPAAWCRSAPHAPPQPPPCPMPQAYVIGRSVLCVPRPTLQPGQLDPGQPVQLLGRISATAPPGEQQAQASPLQQVHAQADAGHTPTGAAPAAAGEAAAAAEAAAAGLEPAPWALGQLAAHLSSQLSGLSLFNIDIIPDLRQAPSSGSNGSSRYLVVDVNYFPGYDKVPGAEQLFAQYCSNLCGARAGQAP